MLLSLDIRNFAIIEAIHLDFDKGLTIITGETGAGKSILMGALGLVLGKRADTQVLRDKSQKCTVEAVFDVNGYYLQDFFHQNDLDYEDQTVIRREINISGKSRAFINDVPVTLDVLQELTVQLIDIHGQLESQQLLHPAFYLRILDHIGGIQEEVNSFKKDFLLLDAMEKELDTLEKAIAKSRQEESFLQFQYDELQAAGLDEPGISSIEQELELLENAELVKTNVLQAVNQLDEEEMSVSYQIREINRLLHAVSGYSNEILLARESLEEWVNGIRELCRNLKQVADQAAYDPERIAMLMDKQSSLNRLLHKHQCQEIESLIIIRDDLENQLSGFQIDTEKCHLLGIEIYALREAVFIKAQSISKKRRQLIAGLETKVTELLHELGMPYATVQWKGPVLSKNEIKYNGIDDIDLYFAPNKGSTAQSLEHIGSGGEKSRLMLAIKSVLAGSLSLPTLIFDEIDTGVSGSIAGKIGDIFKKMAVKHQLVAITHLPQVAARGNKHFNVLKMHDKTYSYTAIETLDGEERIRAIAAMLSNEKPGEAALQTARELMH